ncbi:hypothetical protein SETIT_1G372900v2 [Setaria italica]|uniref:Uncharacterized protein n=1 Tax=Setaria italica TaxID=4555 RepID=A0A368PT95_SETIT|nr:hypothetical protein SETIT_1G372900v2 [Setaria italica]
MKNLWPFFFSLSSFWKEPSRRTSGDELPRKAAIKDDAAEPVNGRRRHRTVFHPSRYVCHSVWRGEGRSLTATLQPILHTHSLSARQASRV